MAQNNIVGLDGTTPGTCSNCHYFSLTQDGVCQRFPTFVARIASDACGEWKGNPATINNIITAFQLQKQQNIASVIAGNPAPASPAPSGNTS